MEFTNYTSFKLTVFSEIIWVRTLLFGVFLDVYLVTLLANLLLITLRLIDPHLHTPMYFFLSHLSFIDIFFTSTIAPKLLSNLLSEDASITFLGCATQLCIALALGTSECLLLAIMAYDRHAAICQPLQYHVLMNQRICILLAAGCWICGFVNSLLHTAFTFFRPCYKSREIGHFFCELQPLLKLSCHDTYIHELVAFITAVPVGLCSFLLTLLSYIHIIATILTMHSSEGKSKVFSTCSSHLLVVIIFYGTIIFIYLRPNSSYNPKRDRVISVFYTAGIPMFNPLIYSIRNKEIKGAMRKAMGKIHHFLRM